MKLIKIKFNKYFVSRWGETINGHTEWLYVKGGIDDILNLPYNNYQVK